MPRCRNVNSHFDGAGAKERGIYAASLLQ